MSSLAVLSPFGLGVFKYNYDNPVLQLELKALIEARTTSNHGQRGSE